MGSEISEEPYNQKRGSWKYIFWDIQVGKVLESGSEWLLDLVFSLVRSYWTRY